MKVIKAYYAYPELSFIAEVGGYVGLFLGFSIYQITDGVNFVLGKLITFMKIVD